jgi:hypothetical protein
VRRAGLVAGTSLIAAPGLVAALGASSPPWANLRRPLHLPQLAASGRCPVSRVDRRVDWEAINIFGTSGTGRGPAYPGLGGTGGRLTTTPDTQHGGSWAGGKVFWYVKPSYRGRVLVRGRRLDNRERLGFNGRALPNPELRIEPGRTVSWQGQPPGSRGVPSAVRVRSPGCYGVQIDGTTFSRVVVFRVEIAR